MPDWLFQLMTAAAGAVGMYVGVRADLARLHERATQALETATRAHERIDNLQGARR